MAVVHLVADGPRATAHWWPFTRAAEESQEELGRGHRKVESTWVLSSIFTLMLGWD